MHGDVGNQPLRGLQYVDVCTHAGQGTVGFQPVIQGWVQESDVSDVPIPVVAGRISPGGAAGFHEGVSGYNERPGGRVQSGGPCRVTGRNDWVLIQKWSTRDQNVIGEIKPFILRSPSGSESSVGPVQRENGLYADIVAAGEVYQRVVVDDQILLPGVGRDEVAAGA